MKKHLCLTGILAVIISLSGCSKKETIYVAWRDNPQAESCVNLFTTLTDLGYKAVMLPQVIDYDLPYTDNRLSSDCISENDYLAPRYADLVKSNAYKNSNISQVMKGVKGLIFPGGEDISPSLFQQPAPWHGIQEEKNYNATRDVSDYLLMSYCIDNDLAVLAICRGGQMLAVASGLSLIQDISVYCEENNLSYRNEHRNAEPSPGAFRDYASHAIKINPQSKLHQIMGTEKVDGCPSWHHQAILSLDGSNLLLAATADLPGFQNIEAIEVKDKKFIIGIQYHPEAAYAKHLNNAPNKNLYMQKKEAAKIFTAFAKEIAD